MTNMATEKPVTIREFKTFIDAVEFAADSDNWIPSERQWKRIRSMIERLEEESPAPSAPSAPQVMRLPEPQYMSPPAGPVVMAPGGLAGHHPQQLPPPGPFATGGPAPVRTPDVDTSNGPYKSSFA